MTIASKDNLSNFLIKLLFFNKSIYICISINNKNILIYEKELNKIP
mgnify:FL=1